VCVCVGGWAVYFNEPDINVKGLLNPMCSDPRSPQNNELIEKPKCMRTSNEEVGFFLEILCWSKFTQVFCQTKNVGLKQTAARMEREYLLP